jgi:translocation and assembly module TamA
LRQGVGGLLTLALVLAPAHVHAQSREAEPALEDLIPDSAIDNPEAWAGQTTAGQQAQAPLAADNLDPSAPLAPLPEMELAWPGATERPAVEPLSPDPDIEQARKEVESDLAALGVPAAGEAPRFADAEVHRVSKDVELAFAPGVDFPARDEFEDRFALLSTLKRLDNDDKDNLAQVSRRARSDRDLLQQMLRVYGYYDAEVYQSLKGEAAREDGTAPPADLKELVVRFDVVPGPRYTYGAVTLGDLMATGPDYPALRAAFEIAEGQGISSDDIVRERVDLTAALGETGYAFAKVGDPELLIDHARRQGDLDVPVSNGGKYKFGEIVSSLPRFLSSRHLAQIARFDPGETYKLSLVDDLRRAILATGLVSTVSVTPRETVPPSPGQPGTVAMDVALTKAPLRTIAGLAGFSSGEGLRVEASWEHRNLFPPEGMLRVRAVAGTREQLAGVTFRRNNFTGRDKVLSLDLYAQTVDRDAFNARTASLLASFERQSTIIYQKDFVWSVGLEAVATSEREGSVDGVRPPRRTFFIGALPVRAGIDESDNLLDPTRGFRASLRVSPELSVQNGKRSTYVNAQADASYYQPVGDRVVLAARARLGTITGAGIDDIAPSRRFYAGGGGSVRGYGYQQIGPRNAADQPSGGRSLSELSVEARVKTGLFGGALSVVPFVDAGAVDETSTPRLSDLRFGAGIGVRYHTNFGPLRVDIGTPLNRRKGDSPIGVYVALGQAF